MFMGEYNHTLDPKNRVSVPAKFKEELGEPFVISAGLDGCLFISKKEEWEAFAKRLSELPFTAETRKFQRHFMRNAVECVTDKLGRVIIPQNLKELAGLEKDVVMVGASNKIELWSKERLDRAMGDESMEDIAEKMSKDYNLCF